MKKISKEAFANYRFERAKEDLEVAQILLNMNKYKDSNNRAYYAIFHAIKAILALEGIDFKRHKDVLAYFNKTYVKTEIFPRELGKQLKNASIVREASDYEDFYIATKAEAEEQISVAKCILEHVEKYIKELNS